MSGDRGVWAYAITQDTTGANVSSLAGVAGAPVRTATAGGMTVLVSDVDLAEFGEDALRRNLEDLGWLEEVARAHHGVIAAASELFPLLPTRLATVYSSDESMAAVLDGRREELLAAMRRVGGRVEWGVKAYAVPQSERHETAGRDEPAPAAGSAPADAGGRGAGLAYLKRRKAQLSARAESQRFAAEAANAVHQHLSGHAAEARLHPPQSPRLTGDQRPMMLNAAYLIDADDTGFAAEVAAVADAHPELDLSLTGPWPPYSFAGDAGEGG